MNYTWLIHPEAKQKLAVWAETVLLSWSHM